MGWLWHSRNTGRGLNAQNVQNGQWTRKRGKSNSRPRVAQAIGEAREAHLGATPHLGAATAVLERAIWSHDLPSYPAVPQAPASSRGGSGAEGALGAASMTSGAPARRRDFGNVDLLLERAENTARRLGRSRAEMWEEALGAWLETQMAKADVAFDLGALGDGLSDAEPPSADTRPAPRPWLFEARRQRVWGEIDQTLGALRSA